MGLALLFRDALFGGGMLFQRDIHLIWWAQIEQFVRTIANGALPLWDPSYGFGQPMLAVPETQVLYPPSWLNLVVGLDRAYALFALGHLWVSATGMYLFCRLLRLRRGAAFLGAGLWAFSGPLLSLVNVWHHFAGAAWIPWTAFWTERFLVTRRQRIAVLWGSTVAIQVLAGSGEMVVMSACASLVLVLRRGRHLRRPSTVRGIVVAAGLAVGLSAVLWFPVVELVAHSGRAELRPATHAPWSLHPWSLLELIVPVNLNDLPLAAAARAVLFAGREPFLLSVYLGLPTFSLVLLSIARPRRGTLAFLILALGSIAIAMGTHLPLYRWLVSALPVLGALRYPTKVLVLTASAWSVLAAMAADSVLRRRVPPRQVVGTCLVLASAAGALLVFKKAWLGPLLIAGSSRGIALPVLGALAATLAFAACAFFSASATSPRAVAFAMLLIPLAELAFANRSVNPTVRRDLAHIRPPLVGRLTTGSVSGRLFVYEYRTGSRGNALITHPNPRTQAAIREAPYLTRFPQPGLTDDETRALAYQLYLLPPIPARWGFATGLDEDLRNLYRQPVRAFLESWRRTDATPLSLRMLQLSGIEHVVALHKQGWYGLEHVGEIPNLFYVPTQLFRVPDTLPRTYWVGRAIAVAPQEWEQVLLSPAFDPHREVCLAKVGATEIGHGRRDARGHATLVEERTDRLIVETEAPVAGYLVILDSFDPGWRAEVDGRRVETRQANQAFRAVAVPPGRHVVVMRYCPTAVPLGLALAAASLVLACHLGRRA